MKKIEAIIRPLQFEHVRDALAEIGVIGLNKTEIQGYGRQKGHTEVYRGTEYFVESHAYLKIEFVIEDEYLEDVIEKITLTARTGKLGDGKILVSNLEKIVSIRTGEENINATI